LRLLVGNQTARSFAADLNISPSGLHQYLKGKSDPSMAVLSLIANKTGANLEWLVNGTGPMLKARNHKVKTMNVGFCAQLSDKPYCDAGNVARVRPLKERVEFDINLTEGVIKSVREYYKDWPEVLEALDEEIKRRQEAGSMESPKKIAANLVWLVKPPSPPNLHFCVMKNDESGGLVGSVRINGC
jgi:transcriptional regulator with XRE-family HTH domain